MRMCACVHVCVRAGVRACVRFADVLTDKFDLVHSFRFRKDARCVDVEMEVAVTEMTKTRHLYPDFFDATVSFMRLQGGLGARGT